MENFNDEDKNSPNMSQQNLETISLEPNKEENSIQCELAFEPIKPENDQEDNLYSEEKSEITIKLPDEIEIDQIENTLLANEKANVETESHENEDHLKEKKDTDSDEDKKKITNSITVVSDFSDPKLDSKNQMDMDSRKVNLSFSPSSSSSELHSPNQVSKFSTNYQNSFDNSSDVVPRKNSPIPTSPPTNIDLENETSSIEHLSSLNNLDSNSGFKRVKSDRSSKISESGHQSYRLTRNHSAKNKPKIDAKNEKISYCLDKWYKELKGQVLTEFEKSKAQLYHEQEKKFFEEKEKQYSEIIKLRREIEFLKETVKLNEKNLLKKDAALDNMTKAFDKQREKNELQRVMMEWKLKRLENAKETFTTKLAEKYYDQRLKMKMFFNWQCFLISKHKTKVEKACKKKAEEVCYDLATNYESRIKKLEEELHSSRMEIEKYRIEMSKNEENMRKALMRGVCALNMEAMSIFNENQLPNPHSTEHQTVANFQKADAFSSSMPTLKTANSLNDLSRKQDGENDLARKVKSYCETNLSKKNKITESTALSAVAKARLQLLNSNNKNCLDTNPVTEEQDFGSNVPNQKLYSNNNIFDELTEHNIIPTKKIGTKHSNVKSKIGSLPRSNTTLGTGQLGSTLPPYRSVVIEKHTKNNQTNDEVSVKTMTTKVKYSPPGQSANVLNTVITT